jgi:2,4-dienoyl-CoA reductase-like NADH-dependent reductase (Old Yellow Enzyme family)
MERRHTMTSKLFSPLTLRGVAFRNRIFVSPMCQYSGTNGMPSDWHLVHLGSRAVGGAACVIQEATAVTPEGRISPADLGIWSDAHTEAYKPITAFIEGQGAVPGIQLAHAGRKASVAAPWEGEKAIQKNEGGWTPLAPSALAFADHSSMPTEMTEAQIAETIAAFAAATHRARAAGYRLVEIHAAHGYLLHEFLSPLSNKRTDRYGGSLENRMRLVCEVASAVRKAWPETLPLFVRISASDWAEGGWEIEQSVALAQKLKERGVDLIDTSSAGLVPTAKITVGPGYQVPFAERIRKDAAMPTGAVGMIADAKQAAGILDAGQADIVLLARELLRDPYWPLHAAQALGDEIAWPKQYDRAKPRRAH